MGIAAFIGYAIIILMMCVPPAARTHSRRQGISRHEARAPLRRAFRAPRPDPALNELARAAGDAIDDLDRGVIATGETYDRAAGA